MIHDHEEDRDQLYNLDTDPGEQNDVMADNRATANELRRRLYQWLVEVDARFPTPDPQYDPEKERDRLRTMEHDLLPKLEAEHAGYLDPEWQPNEDWWGSQVTTD